MLWKGQHEASLQGWGTHPCDGPALSVLGAQLQLMLTHLLTWSHWQ